MDITVSNITKKYGTETVLNNFSHTFKENTFTVIMGRSGVGKTTLLKILSGLEAPDSGSITGIDGKKISFVFQENRLCSNLTGYLNVRMVLEEKKITPKSDLYKRISAAFKKVNLDISDKKPVSNYSGGMKRRIAILRALFATYDILFMDEPLKGLDNETKDSVISLIKEMTAGKTVIMVTHDLSEAESFNAEVLELK